MTAKQLKEKLASGELVIGCEAYNYKSSGVAEHFAELGFDFMSVDFEHSSTTLSEAGEIARMANRCGIVPLARIPDVEYSMVSRLLDISFKGIILPRVRDAQQVITLNSFMRYPPKGVRGVNPYGAVVGFRLVAPSEYVRMANEDLLLIVQFETPESVRNADSILATGCVDVACTGPLDMTLNMGIIGDFDHPGFIALFEDLIHSAGRHGVPSGTAMIDAQRLRYWINRGMRFVWIGNECTLLQAAAQDFLRVLRAPEAR